MKKNAANLLLVAMSTGLILAGCNQQPAQTSTPSTTETNGSISIQENKDASASMNVTDTSNAIDAANDAITNANASTSAAMEAANKAMLDANAQLDASGVVNTPEAKAAMEAANKAMLDANASTSAAMDAANKAVVDANAQLDASTSASVGN